MAEPMVIDVDEAVSNGKMNCSDQRKTLKRKRGVAGGLPELSPEERSAKIKSLREELKSLFNFYRELNGKKENQNVEDYCLNSNNIDSAIAILMEESDLPLSKLVNEIFEKLKGKFGNGNGNGNGGNGGLSSFASVKSRVLLIGQRVFYGISDADADLLEDDAESALWCWETRDMKLVPKSMRAVLKGRRTYRKKIQERLIAVSAMIAALENSESHQNYQELMKASERLGKILNEGDIRILVDNVLQKTGAEGEMKEAKQEEKHLIKQLEKNKRDEEKEKRRMEREIQKQKLQNEKELKRLQDEAEKEEKRREKEESEMKKLIKKSQEEAEKDQLRKEKEEAETRKQLSLQKQASLMERFLKRGKTDLENKNDQPPSHATDSSLKRDKEKPESVTQAMDSVLSMNSETNAENIWKLHLNSWHFLGNSIRLNRHMHWGIRRRPKTKLVKELKLTPNSGLAREEEMNIENLVDGWVGSSTDSRFSPITIDNTIPNCRTHIRSKQLLQFDKSHRPAFYGFRLKKSQVVSARHPFIKDPELDYEIDSDEEWEEEEPGESLSDCDKDGEEESLDEGCSRGDDGDESEDGFFVPDGYLSEDEGVEVDKTDANHSIDETHSPGSNEALPSEAVNQLFRQRKYLYNLTEHSLRKNQPLFVLNLMHQKAPLLSADNVTGTEKLEQMCLQALSICAFPYGSSVQISISDDTGEDQGVCTSNTKTSSTALASTPTLSDSDLAQIVPVIQSCSHGINKVVESLHEKFPSMSKSQLRNKVREISDFVNSRWQVKKDVLVKLGLTISPAEKGSGRRKSIATFFSKRCLPPGKSINPIETSPQASQKFVASTQQQEGNAP